MNTIRIEFSSKSQRDLALSILDGLDYPRLWESEPGSENIRAQAGEKIRGLRVTNARHSIVIRCPEIFQWVAALTAVVAHQAGVRGQDHPWAEVYVNNELFLVANTSKDVRGTRGLVEVDPQGRLLLWRDRGGLTHGPQAEVQKQAVEQILAGFAIARIRQKVQAKTVA